MVLRKFFMICEEFQIGGSDGVFTPVRVVDIVTDLSPRGDEIKTRDEAITRIRELAANHPDCRLFLAESGECVGLAVGVRPLAEFVFNPVAHDQSSFSLSQEFEATELAEGQLVQR